MEPNTHLVIYCTAKLMPDLEENTFSIGHSNSMSFTVLEQIKIDTHEEYIVNLFTFNIVSFRPSKTKTTNMFYSIPSSPFLKIIPKL